MHHKKTYALLALLLFITEVIIATKLNHYAFIRHYFGDFLVVILLYVSIKTFINIPAKPLMMGVIIIAFSIETAQYFHIADHLGLTKGGILRLIIGTSFSVSDLLMYTAGAFFIYWADLLFLDKKA